MAYTSNQEVKELAIADNTKSEARVQAIRRIERHRVDMVCNQIETLKGRGFEGSVEFLISATDSMQLLYRRVLKELDKRAKRNKKKASR